MIEKGCAGERLRARLKVTETLTSGWVYCVTYLETSDQLGCVTVAER